MDRDEVLSAQVHKIDKSKDRYPCCVVWTPIPLLTWLCPFIGHTGIGMSNGVIRDFALPYKVSEDNMAFGSPVKYWQMQPDLAVGGIEGWDDAVYKASEIYKHKMHRLWADNCHSHVATALNLMQYDNSTKWNMVKLALLLPLHSRYVSVWGFLKTWLPFVTIVILIFVGFYCFV